MISQTIFQPTDTVGADGWIETGAPLLGPPQPPNRALPAPIFDVGIQYQPNNGATGYWLIEKTVTSDISGPGFLTIPAGSYPSGGGIFADDQTVAIRVNGVAIPFIGLGTGNLPAQSVPVMWTMGANVVQIEVLNTVAGGTAVTGRLVASGEGVPCDCCPVSGAELKCWDDGAGNSGMAAPFLCCAPIVGATYEVDWSYAHRARGGAGAETAELRIGDASNPLLTNPVVDTHLGIVGTWVMRSGTLPIGAGFGQLRFEFNSIGGAPGVGNLLDSCSIILRRVLPTPVNFGEQLVNGGFEVPAFGANSLNFPLTSTPGIGWQTTDTCNCLEVWHQNFLGVPAHSGTQLVEMNAFNRATLFQTVSLETCETQISWYDTSGTLVPAGNLVACPSCNPRVVNDLTIAGVAFNNLPDGGGADEYLTVTPVAASTSVGTVLVAPNHYHSSPAAPASSCGGRNMNLTLQPASSFTITYEGLSGSAVGGVFIQFQAPSLGGALNFGLFTSGSFVPGNVKTINIPGGHAALTYVSGPTNTNAPRGEVNQCGLGAPGDSLIGLHRASTSTADQPISFRLDFETCS